MSTPCVSGEPVQFIKLSGEHYRMIGLTVGPLAMAKRFFVQEATEYFGQQTSRQVWRECSLKKMKNILKMRIMSQSIWCLTVNLMKMVRDPQPVQQPVHPQPAGGQICLLKNGEI